MTAIILSRAIGPVPITVVLRENHQSSIGITKNPIETGAEVTDHAYVEAKELSLEFADENATATFNALVRFQESRVPFTVVSGLFVYNNMLIASLTAERDFQYSRVLKGNAQLQEAIMVSTAKTSGSNSTSAEKAKDATTKDKAGGTVARGDQASEAVAEPKRTSILKGMFQ